VAQRRRLHAEPYEPPPAAPLPSELDPRRLRRRALTLGGLLVVVALVAWLAPGLGEVRSRLEEAEPWWLVAAVVLEVLSCLSYVLMFRPVFCRHMRWRTAYELGMSELAVGSIVPAAGAGGLALGVWALRRGGMPAEDIGRRTVAFFLLKSATNFAAVAVLGTLLAVGILGPKLSLALTLLPAALAVAVIALVASIPSLVAHRGTADPPPGASRLRRAWVLGTRSLTDGVREAVALLRRHDVKVIAGSLGYWAFDNAVLWATFHAFGRVPALSVVLMAYLIGQLGGVLPLPGGLGGIDGGLIGALVVFGVPVASAAAAVLAYRLVLFWVPLALGSVAFASLRRGLSRPDRPDLCDPALRVAA
jgi:uncharacterized membrane protein YbhN (UPF0104 family)